MTHRQVAPRLCAFLDPSGAAGGRAAVGRMSFALKNIFCCLSLPTPLRPSSLSVVGIALQQMFSFPDLQGHRYHGTEQHLSSSPELHTVIAADTSVSRQSMHCYLTLDNCHSLGWHCQAGRARETRVSLALPAPIR